MSTHPLHPIHPGSRPHIERLRALCLALPEVTEKLAWGAPTWRVGGRLFAQLADHHHGNPHLAVWLAAPAGAQEALIEAEPGRFFRPAYVGHLGWVAAILDERSDWEMVAAVVRQAHREAAGKLPARRAREILAAAEARGEEAPPRQAKPPWATASTAKQPPRATASTAKKPPRPRASTAKQPPTEKPATKKMPTRPAASSAARAAARRR